MKLDQPRVIPCTDDEIDPENRPTFEAFAKGNNGRVLNIFRTLARHPKLMKRWLVFGNHVLGGSTLPVRERELAILRTGYIAGSGYEWAQHVDIARRCGITDTEIEAIVTGPDASSWSAEDATLLRATDQLLNDRFIDDGTWAALSTRWDEKQRMDLVFAVGQYNLVSMALNTFGVQIEDGVDRFPAAQFAGNRFPHRS